MVLLFALLTFLSPTFFCIAQNEPAEVIGSEVRTVPDEAPAAPAFTDPPPSEPAVLNTGDTNRPNVTESPELPVISPNPAQESTVDISGGTTQPGQAPVTTPSTQLEFELVTDRGNVSEPSPPRPDDQTSSSSPERPLPAQPQPPPAPLPSQPTDPASDLLRRNESEPSPELLSNGTGEINANQTRPSQSHETFLLPSKITKIRMTIIGFTGKPVRTFNLTADQVLYQMKVFWLEPESWQDIGWNPSDRYFELFCWLATNGGFERDLFRGNLSGSLITHSQWYAFPETEQEHKRNVSIHCGIRPVNGAGKGGEWSFSEPGNVREAPVFLRGFENVNVRGWSREEVVRFVAKEKRHDTPDQANENGAKAKAKERRSS